MGPVSFIKSVLGLEVLVNLSKPAKSRLSGQAAVAFVASPESPAEEALLQKIASSVGHVVDVLNSCEGKDLSKYQKVLVFGDKREVLAPSKGALCFTHSLKDLKEGPLDYKKELWRQIQSWTL